MMSKPGKELQHTYCSISHELTATRQKFGQLIKPLKSNNLVNISKENASIRILEALLWLQLIYFLITIAFWFVKYIFRLMLTLNQLPQSVTKRFYFV